jgi:hypothetical protein
MYHCCDPYIGVSRSCQFKVQSSKLRTLHFKLGTWNLELGTGTLNFEL